MYLFFDTETTGFAQFKKLSSDPDQPGLVQLGAVLDDENRKTIGTLNVIVQSNIPVSLGAFKKHKITDERIEKDGIELKDAIEQFHSMAMKATECVAHNNKFDLLVMEANYFRARIPVLNFVDKKQTCTMIAATKVLKIPGKYGYKWPKLDEAYKILVDEKGFEGAHDAMNDVMACRAVFYAMKDRGDL